MMKQKVIFLDLDDTLLNRQKQVSSGNRNAINRALQAGHKVVITTGRPLDCAMRQAVELGLTGEGCYLISFNGAIIYDMFHREIVYSHPLEFGLTTPIFAEAKRRDVHIQTFDDWSTYVEPWCENSKEIQWYCAKNQVPYTVLPQVADLNQKPNKMLCTSLDDKGKLERFKRWVDEHYSEVIDTYFSCEELLEIVPLGISKGSAVLRLCRMLDLPVENAIACGDAENDITMIRAAGLGVAMRNAIPEAQAAADYITERDCDHDGIAEVIEKFMLA